MHIFFCWRFFYPTISDGVDTEKHRPVKDKGDSYDKCSVRTFRSTYIFLKATNSVNRNETTINPKFQRIVYFIDLKKKNIHHVSLALFKHYPLG
jgi:hypothetical protein